MYVVKLILVIFISIFIYTIAGYCQLPQFVKEKIEITVENNSCLIEGDYYFRNKHSIPIKRSLFYPFPIDSTMLYPDSINVFDVQNNKNISFFRAKTGIYFSIVIPPGKTVLYKVSYRQKTTNNKIEYILTSTQKWGEALKKADFIIKLCSNFELKYCSYKYDDKQKIKNHIIYKIHKENFMPKKNLIIEWVGRL